MISCKPLVTRWSQINCEITWNLMALWALNKLRSAITRPHSFVTGWLGPDLNPLSSWPHAFVSHNEAWIKCPPFCRRHFGKVFVEFIFDFFQTGIITNRQALVRFMNWRWAASHCLNQWWPVYWIPVNYVRPQFVNSLWPNKAMWRRRS